MVTAFALLIALLAAGPWPAGAVDRLEPAYLVRLTSEDFDDAVEFRLHLEEDAGRYDASVEGAPFDVLATRVRLGAGGYFSADIETDSGALRLRGSASTSAIEGTWTKGELRGSFRAEPARDPAEPPAPASAERPKAPKSDETREATFSLTVEGEVEGITVPEGALELLVRRSEPDASGLEAEVSDGRVRLPVTVASFDGADFAGEMAFGDRVVRLEGRLEGDGRLAGSWTTKNGRGRWEALPKSGGADLRGLAGF